MTAPAARPSTDPKRAAAARKSKPRTAQVRGAYASDLMLARRQAILQAAKELIAERGAQGFTIRQLSDRAKVSVTTIYATYGDKESLLAAAIVDFYDKLPVAGVPAPRTLAEVLAAADTAHLAVMADKRYAREYVLLHYSGAVDPRIHAAVRQTVNASAGKLQWLDQVRRKGDILEGLAPDVVETSLINSRLGLLHEWVQGRITDAQLATQSRLTFLLFARSVTRGDTLAEVERELTRSLKAAQRA